MTVEKPFGNRSSSKSSLFLLYVAANSISVKRVCFVCLFAEGVERNEQFVLRSVLRSGHESVQFHRLPTQSFQFTCSLCLSVDLWTGARESRDFALSGRRCFHGESTRKHPRLDGRRSGAWKESTAPSCIRIESSRRVCLWKYSVGKRTDGHDGEGQSGNEGLVGCRSQAIRVWRPARWC